jgi:hypothetical protein
VPHPPGCPVSFIAWVGISQGLAYRLMLLGSSGKNVLADKIDEEMGK